MMNTFVGAVGAVAGFVIALAALGALAALMFLAALAHLRLKAYEQRRKAASPADREREREAADLAARVREILDDDEDEAPAQAQASPSDPAIEVVGGDVRVHVPPPSIEQAARDAVAQTGLTGMDAERLYEGILKGVAEARANGNKQGTIAVLMEPGALSLESVKRVSTTPPGFRPRNSVPFRPSPSMVPDDDDKPVS